ncbi:Ribulose-5-phosphate 4-epimerase/Fuculose-1-phosphate aldolase [Tistlia consotensis]|uniref:Ribulose-5-phosphate 4-epimerase/Fuculose-1-phosphate aldolase n=1 Tax=Tistlia consotensis USBA 355 TaxID=560819 RepID=A0A1Y6BIP6_9PROT|nr:aldolase [Tistlia consotensis]SMF13338.1 Ribulose-5-phosphate 4-epimerase/Fuculose-1-phosphate aldolase [Tistlia consotensis USBA 355]SNR50583.1 Ribulose-5-phosphate 4-epimerase/Fuculose-1-phosphate aldolase [Tistlia consotensis]
MENLIHQAKVDLAASLRLAARFGFNEGVCNHFSFAVPGMSDRYLLNPHGVHWSQMTPDDILLIDGEGRTVEGRSQAELTAFTIHGAIHRANPRAHAVLHTHMPYATALCCVEETELEPISQNALRFWNDVAYDWDYNGLAEDAAEGARMAACLGDKKVLFLGNHGVIVVGESIARAFDDLYYLERACELQVLALSTGKPLRRIGDNVAGKAKADIDGGPTATYAAKHFDGLKAVLDAEAPGWRG